MNRKKIVPILIVLFFVLVLALSLDVIAVRAEHDCCGEGCRICATLQVADELCGGDKKADTAVVGCPTRFSRVEVFLSLATVCATINESPVSRCDILTI